MVTLDVARQAPGPRWTTNQWCVYWRERQGDARAAWAHGAGALPGQAGRTTHGGAAGLRCRGATSDAAAHMSAAGGSSSSRGGGDMDDEADSAFVHQG